MLVGPHHHIALKPEERVAGEVGVAKTESIGEF